MFCERYDCQNFYTISTAMNEKRYCSLACEQFECEPCQNALAKFDRKNKINCPVHGRNLPYNQGG